MFVSLATAHGTPIYATVVVENFAGLQSVFSSNVIVLDHTPPIIENIAAVEEIEYLPNNDDVDVDVANSTDLASNDDAPGNNSIPAIFRSSDAFTTPVFTEPVSTPSSVSAADKQRRVRLKISWQTRDKESGIKMCMVSVGT